MAIFDGLFGYFGYGKMPAKVEEQKLPATRVEIIDKIAGGLAYDLKLYNNWISDYFNPNPVMKTAKFRQEGGYAAFESMDGDAHVLNCMSTLKDELLSRTCYVRSAKPGDATEDKKAALVAWNLDHIKQVAQKKREILSALDYGFSVTEAILEQINVKIPAKQLKKNNIITDIPEINMPNAVVIRDLQTKVPTAFSFDAAGNLMICEQSAANLGFISSGPSHRILNNEELQHFLVLTHDPRFGSRYGWPLKASFFFDVLMKRAAKIYRMIFVEKYSMPYLVGTYPAGANSAGNTRVSDFENIIRGAQKNSWMVKPEGFAIEFVDAMEKSGSMDVYQNLLDFCDGNISEVTLGHRHAVDSASVGSFSSAEVKEAALRQTKLEALASEMDGLFNDQFIPRLIDFNFTPNGLYPYVITDVEPEADKNKRIFQFSAASNLGLPLSPSQLRDEMKLNEPEDDADILMPVGVDMSPTNVGEGNNGGADPNLGGENSKNEEISDGTRKSAQKMATNRPGMSLTINL